MSPNVNNFINWIEKFYRTNENQYFEGEVQDHKDRRGLQFMKFDQNVSRCQEINTAL